MSASSGQLQSFTIDQAAGALALSLGAIGSLLLVVWQSRCLCRCRIGCSDTCYLFDCAREPPKEEVADENASGAKLDKNQNNRKKLNVKGLRRSPRLAAQPEPEPQSQSPEPQSQSPEPEMIIPPNADPPNP